MPFHDKIIDYGRAIYHGIRGIDPGASARYIKDRIDRGLGGEQPDRPDFSRINLPYFGQDRRQIQQLMRRGSPYAQSAQLGQSQYGGDIGSYIQQLQNMAAGRGPSLAQQEYKSASDAALSNQLAMSQSGRGNPGLAAQTAASNMARIQQGLGAGLAQARTGEQLGAIGQLGGALGMAGGLELQRQSTQAGMEQQTNLANQQAWMQLLAAKLGLSEQQLQALLGRGQLEAQVYATEKGVPSNWEKILKAFSGIPGT